jgi:predicted Fe-Mo cluster-binding NifX family protein
MKGTNMDLKNVKVAFVTDDGNTISPHFGRAMYYEVLTINNGKITNRERREKAGHHTFYKHEEHREHHGQGHGNDEHSQHKHHTMTANILDCGILVARGMGNGAFQHILNANIKPIITNTAKIDDAVQEIVNGTIVNHVEKLH